MGIPIDMKLKRSCAVCVPSPADSSGADMLSRPKPPPCCCEMPLASLLLVLYSERLRISRSIG